MIQASRSPALGSEPTLGGTQRPSPGFRRTKRVTDDYAATLPTFDVGLSLMASAHPSLTPMDLAGSGVPVVTNSFGVKDAGYFASISENIICVRPTLEDLVEGIRRAVLRSEDLAAREAGASINFPTDWDGTWTPRHRAMLTSTLGALMERAPSPPGETAQDLAPAGSPPSENAYS